MPNSDQFCGLGLVKTDHIFDRHSVVLKNIDRTAVTLKKEEYRHKAEEAETMAKSVKESVARQTYLEIARQWREMAAQAERNGW